MKNRKRSIEHYKVQWTKGDSRSSGINTRILFTIFAMNVSNFPFTFHPLERYIEMLPSTFIHMLCYFFVRIRTTTANAAYLSNTLSYPSYFSVVLLSHPYDWGWVSLVVSTLYATHIRDNSSIYFHVLHYPHFPCLCFDLDIHSRFSDAHKPIFTHSIVKIAFDFAFDSAKLRFGVCRSFAKQKWTSNALRRGNNRENSSMAHPKNAYLWCKLIISLGFFF